MADQKHGVKDWLFKIADSFVNFSRNFGRNPNRNRDKSKPPPVPSSSGGGSPAPSQNSGFAPPPNQQAVSRQTMRPLMLCQPFCKASLLKGSFKTIVVLPKYVDEGEWIALNGKILADCGSLSELLSNTLNSV